MGGTPLYMGRRFIRIVRFSVPHLCSELINTQRTLPPPDRGVLLQGRATA
jgi:hypothetical protein